MAPVTGDRVLHLQHGLGDVIAIKESPLPSAIVRIESTGQELWVPLSAWTEHATALPTRDEAEAWRASVLADGPQPPAGREAAEERERTLEYRGVDRQLAALRDAYRCGDRSGAAEQALEALEARLLPILAFALDTSVPALSTRLRAAMPEHAHEPAPEEVLALAGLETLGRGELTDDTCVGDGATRVRTRPGAWLGYAWQDAHYHVRLILLHEAHAARWNELRGSLVEVGSAYADGGSALVYQPCFLDDAYFGDLLYSQAGVLAGKGFASSLGGDGGYQILGVYERDELICLVAGDALEPPDEQQFRHGQ